MIGTVTTIMTGTATTTMTGTTMTEAVTTTMTGTGTDTTNIAAKVDTEAITVTGIGDTTKTIENAIAAIANTTPHHRLRHRYAGYPYPGAHYDYRPSFGQRIRQFFGFAPASPHYQYKSDTHSWGFLGRSKRPRYIDARTGVEVDRHGRTVHRI
ncbi:hypothetical protein JOM56_008655 [Amanita muscaria]